MFILFRCSNYFHQEEIPEILREYPEMRKVVEMLSAEDFMKGFKLQENSDEEVRYLKLTKDLKFLEINQ